MTRRRLAVLTLAVAIVAGCSASARHAAPPPAGSASSTAAPASGAPSTAGPTTMSSAAAPPVEVPALPTGCAGGLPAAHADLTFVADGRAWATAPGSRGSLRCLFPVTDSGVWSWGPKGDRVLLDGLQVRGVGTTLSRPAGSYDPSYYTWSRPTGTTVWFTDQSQHSMFRADMGYGGSQDITPIRGATYFDMAYHPSGLAVGFVAEPAGAPQGLWMSTNTGLDPQLLVNAPDPGTTFGHIVFAHDGLGLFYSVDTTAGLHTLARYELPTGAVEQSLWSGSAPIDDITELAGVPGVALTVGAACADRHAVFSPLDGGAGEALDPGVPGPGSVVGRLDADRFVVAVGGCGGAPSDLYLVHRSGAAPTLIVRGVTTAGMRTPEPTPAPPLPQNLPRSSFT